jgi:hypothetical protein
MITAADPASRKSRKRDWIILPALGLFIVLALSVTTEVAARLAFPDSQIGLDKCFGAHPMGNARAIPNSVCSEQTDESRYVAEYKFNSAGHRAGMERDAKDPGAYRIVMIGSSFSFGLFVPREMTFAALLPAELSQQTGRKIELYNEASGGEFRGGPYPITTSARDFQKDVLTAHPDMILWIITPNDFENASLDEDPIQTPSMKLPAAVTGVVQSAPPVPGKAVRAWNKLKDVIANGKLGDEIRSRFDQTRTAVVLKHYFYGSQSQSEYVESYLHNEEDAGFLKAQPNARWRHLLANLDSDAAVFEQQASAEGIPFVAVLVPNRAQAAMISMPQRDWPKGYDPFQLDREVRTIIQSHGGTYIDVLPGFRSIPNPEQHYFPVDGHPDTAGHAMISSLIANELAKKLPKDSASAPEVGSATEAAK